MSTLRNEQSLDRPWRFVLDAELCGTEKGWQRDAPWEQAVEVAVPGRWSDWTAAEGGVGWLFHRFNWNAPAEAYIARLCFEGLGPDAELWLNGERLGTHASPLLPAVFDVTPFLRAGENQLALRLAVSERVLGLISHVALPAASTPQRLAGLLGSAVLRVMPKVRIEEIHVLPDCRRNRLNVQAHCMGGDTLRCVVRGTPYTAEAPPGTPLAVEMDGFDAWAPDAPTLYTLECSLLVAGECVDTVLVTFGMSEFTVKDDRFCLNNRPIWLKGVLHEVAYPLRAPRGDWEAAARSEVAAARDAGFNLIYLRGGVAPEATLAAADALGILVAVEAPSEPGASTTLLEATVRRVRNHPCVAFYTAASPGCTDLRDLGPRFACIRALDPNRVILGAPGMAGVLPHAATLLRPFRDSPEDYDDFQVYPGAPLAILGENYLRNIGREPGLCLLSGFGAGGPGDAAAAPAIDIAREGFAARDLASGFGTFEAFLDAARTLQRDAAATQIDAARANSRLAGYLYRQLRSTGTDWTGLLDERGGAQPALAEAEAAQRPVRPLIRMLKTNLVPRETVAVSVLMANEARLEGRGEVSLQVVGPTNQVLWKKKRGVKLPRHGKLLWEGEVSASGSTGMHQFVVRLIYENRIVAENGVEFYVVAEPKPPEISVHLLDPHNTWSKAVGACARLEGLLARIHVVPPLANTVRGYPDNELMQVLAQVRGGAVALVFSPPDDWNALAAQFDDDISATSMTIGGMPAPCYHYAKMHPVFAGLPARGLMGRPYRNVLSWRTFLESGEEDICGSFFSGHADTPPHWGSAILVRRHGEGRLVFVHLRVLEYLGVDTVAEHLFVNLLVHFARRSVPSKSPLAPNTQAVEWLRTMRSDTARRWMVLGEFASEGVSGLDAVLSPETEVDLAATYPGWYQAVTWTPWYTISGNDHLLDLQAAFSPLWQAHPRQDRATGYAYAEFAMERRQAAILCLSRCNATKAWFNGKELFAAVDAPPCGKLAEERFPIFLRQGKNTLLIKCAKEAGPFGFALDILGERGENVPMKWWR